MAGRAHRCGCAVFQASLFRVRGGFVKRFFLFIALILGCWPGGGHASAAEERLIAVIMVNAQSRHKDIHAVFVENSGDFCGSNCRIYVQTPNDDIMSLRNSVRKAVALGARLIVTYGPAASLAVKAEAASVPALFADVYDPVHLELVSVKHETGRNQTGIRGDAPLQTLFKYFVDATGAKKLVVLYDKGSREGVLQKTLLEESGRKRGVAIIPLPVAAHDDHAAALQHIPGDADGLFLANSEHADPGLADVLQFAAARRLPVITQRAGVAEQGAFMVLETSVVEQGAKLAEFAGQVLSGKDIDELPVHKPRQVSFIVNMKVAKEYGIQVPFQTLSVATRVVR